MFGFFLKCINVPSCVACRALSIHPQLACRCKHHHHFYFTTPVACRPPPQKKSSSIRDLLHTLRSTKFASVRRRRLGRQQLQASSDRRRRTKPPPPPPLQPATAHVVAASYKHLASGMQYIPPLNDRGTYMHKFVPQNRSRPDTISSRVRYLIFDP